MSNLNLAESTGQLGLLMVSFTKWLEAGKKSKCRDFLPTLSHLAWLFEGFNDLTRP